MKYVKKISMIIAVSLLAIMGMVVPVMANPSSATTPPKIIALAPISLSGEMREKYSEQTVLVKVKATVSETGIIGDDIKIMTSSGDETFDKAVIDLVHRSLFNPAYSDNTAVKSSFLLPINVKVEKYLPQEEENKQILEVTDPQ